MNCLSRLAHEVEHGVRTFCSVTHTRKSPIEAIQISLNQLSDIQKIRRESQNSLHMYSESLISDEETAYVIMEKGIHKYMKHTDNVNPKLIKIYEELKNHDFRQHESGSSNHSEWYAERREFLHRFVDELEMFYKRGRE